VLKKRFLGLASNYFLRRMTMAVSESGRKLAEMIKKAIDDGKLTTTEYEQILMLAEEDGHIDAHEKSLLSNLQELVENGSVKRIPG
jgi:hypothetical protein